MKRIFSKEMSKTWIVAVAALVVAVVSLFVMPDTIPSHFGPDGTPDAWGTKYVVLMYPGVILLVTILAEPLKRFDPKMKNYERFNKYYYNFFFGFALFFLMIELANIAIAMGADINVGSIICFIVGVLFVFLGNMMPKIKQNFFFGIKTPWALADEENWFKTHRLGGKAFVFSGIVVAISAFTSGTAKIWILMAVLFVVVIGLYVYSAMLHYRKKDVQ